MLLMNPERCMSSWSLAENFSALDKAALSNDSFYHDAPAASHGGRSALIADCDWHQSSSTSTTLHTCT